MPNPLYVEGEDDAEGKADSDSGGEEAMEAETGPTAEEFDALRA